MLWIIFIVPSLYEFNAVKKNVVKYIVIEINHKFMP